MAESFYAVVFSYQQYVVKESKCIVLSRQSITPEQIVKIVDTIFSDEVGEVWHTWFFDWPGHLNWVSDLIPGSLVSKWNEYDIAYVLDGNKLQKTEVQAARYLYSKTTN